MATRLPVGPFRDQTFVAAAQLAAGRALIAALCEEHRGLALRAHREMPGNATDCPGRYFPLSALLAAPPATVAVARRPELKRLMRAYALAHGVRIPAGLAVNRNWGEAARTLAWRISGRLPGVKQTAQPTVELWEALRG